MGKFTIQKTKTGYTFHLLAGNGEIIAVSEVYTTLAACKKGIASVATNAPKAGVEDQTVEGFEVIKNPKFQLYTDKKGEIRFRLTAKNGQTIATSEGYKSKRSASNGVASVAKNAVDAPVVGPEEEKAE